MAQEFTFIETNLTADDLEPMYNAFVAAGDPMAVISIRKKSGTVIVRTALTQEVSRDILGIGE